MKDFYKLCQLVKVTPDLISVINIKKILIRNHLNSSLSCKQFEKAVECLSTSLNANLSEKILRIFPGAREIFASSTVKRTQKTSRKSRQPDDRAKENAACRGKRPTRANSFVKSCSNYTEIPSIGVSQFGNTATSANTPLITDKSHRVLESNPLSKRDLRVKAQKIKGNYGASLSKLSKENSKILKVFMKFKQTHDSLQAPRPPSGASPNNYIASLRSTLFSRDFVKLMIFNAWKLQHTSKSPNY